MRKPQNYWNKWKELNKWRDSLCLWTQGSIVLGCQFFWFGLELQCISIKMPSSYFVNTDKLVLKFIWRRKNLNRQRKTKILNSFKILLYIVMWHFRNWEDFSHFPFFHPQFSASLTHLHHKAVLLYSSKLVDNGLLLLMKSHGETGVVSWFHFQPQAGSLSNKVKQLMCLIIEGVSTPSEIYFNCLPSISVLYLKFQGHMILQIYWFPSLLGRRLMFEFEEFLLDSFTFNRMRFSLLTKNA